MKLAIFHMEEIPTLFMLERAAAEVSFSPYLFHLRNIRFFVDEKGMDLKAGDLSLKNFSLIFVRGFWHYQTEVSLLAKFCKFNRIPLFDTALLQESIISKNDDLFLLHKNGFPLIKTVFLENKKGLPMLLQELKLPIVAKEIRGKRGFDVHLLKNKKQLQEFLNQMIPEEKTLDTKTYQFQEFIPADFDIRVLVLGNRVLGAIERRSSDPHDFRHNISLGGHARQIKVTPELKNLSLRAARILNYQFAGVDFIIHKKTKKLYLLEVNRSPGFEGFMKATGMNVPTLLMQFFLAFSLKVHTIAPSRPRYATSSQNRYSFAHDRTRQARS